MQEAGRGVSTEGYVPDAQEFYPKVHVLRTLFKKYPLAQQVHLTVPDNVHAAQFGTAVEQSVHVLQDPLISPY